MSNDRLVRMCLDRRRIHLEHEAGHDVLTYLGVAVTYIRNGSLEQQIRVPVSEEPTVTDDERL